MAYEFSPAEGLNPDGSSFIDVNGGTFIKRSGGGEVAPSITTNELTGEREIDYEVENFEEPTDGFDEASYVDALISTTPNFHDAVSWANKTQTEGWIERYNDLMDGSLEDINKGVEELMALYEAENDVEEVAPDEEVETEPVSQEQVNDALDVLSSNEPLGMEQAYAFLEQAQATDNPIEREVLMAAGEFHSQQTDANTIIQRLLGKFSPEQLAPFVKDRLG